MNKIRIIPIKTGDEVNYPCPPTGPAHDGRGRGVGMPGGRRRGLKYPGRGGGGRYRAPR
ncbi:MAG: hypothetical protein ACTSYW_10470 [Candidatus Heimdallarchaeota archaeon]